MKHGKPGRIRCAFFCGALLLLLYAAAALGEAAVSFVPASPRVGDVVDITVVPEAEEAKGVQYRLSAGGEKLSFTQKPVPYLSASFRPRKETVYTLEVTLLYAENKTETVSVSIPVSGKAPEERGADIIYSQQDGWWGSVWYVKELKRTLESSGCAVFAVSEALQRLGFEDDAALPEHLAWEYHKSYIEGVGTGTEALVTSAGKDFGFDTQHRLIRAEDEIASFLKRGDLFCLGIVQGHVVLADRIDEAAGKVHIADSAPGVTFEKLKNTPTYVRGDNGSWQTIRKPEEIPGIRWYPETGRFGGAGYWLDLKDCATRGLRLIRRPWLTLTAAKKETAVSPEAFGLTESTVILNGEVKNVSTADLRWQCDGADGPLLAVVAKDRGATLYHRNGDEITKYKPVPKGTALAVLRFDNERVYVYWKGIYAYLNRIDVELKNPGL